MAERKHKKRRVSEGGILPLDKKIQAKLEDLRHFVENFNVIPKISLRGEQTYRELKQDEIYTTKVDGWEFGYKLEEFANGMFRRKIYVKVPGYRLEDVEEEERKAIMIAVFNACLDQGQGMVDVQQTNLDTLLITQDFQPIFLHEWSPNLIVPGNPATKVH